MIFCFALVEQMQSDPHCFSCHTSSYSCSKIRWSDLLKAPGFYCKAFYTDVLNNPAPNANSAFFTKLLLVVHSGSSTASAKNLLFDCYNLLKFHHESAFIFFFSRYIDFLTQSKYIHVRLIVHNL